MAVIASGKAVDQLLTRLGSNPALILTDEFVFAFAAQVVAMKTTAATVLAMEAPTPRLAGVAQSAEYMANSATTAMDKFTEGFDTGNETLITEAGQSHRETVLHIDGTRAEIEKLCP